MPYWEEALGQIQDTLEKLYLSTGLGTLQCGGGGWGERGLGFSA